MKSVHEQLAAALSRSKPKSKKANKKEMKQRRKEIERTSTAVPSAKPKNKPVKSKPKKPQTKYDGIVYCVAGFSYLIDAFAEYQPHPQSSKGDLQVVMLVQMKKKPNQ